MTIAHWLQAPFEVLAAVLYCMNFAVIGKIENIETIASGSGIRDLHRLQKIYGPGNWRKMKGIAHIRLLNGELRKAELHWHEAHDIGKKEIKRKRYLE